MNKKEPKHLQQRKGRKEIENYFLKIIKGQIAWVLVNCGKGSRTVFPKCPWKPFWGALMIGPIFFAFL